MKWLLSLAIAAGLVFTLRRFPATDAQPMADDPTYTDPLESTMLDNLEAMAQATAAAAMTPFTGGTPAQNLSTSEAMKARLKQREGLRLNRYRLGDGGYTIGYGRYYPDGGALPPETIDLATAEAWFTNDLVERGEKWVKLYVTAPINQGQFDALTSMAYNLSPKSFKNIATAVNNGEDPAPVAMRYTRPGTNLERGLIARRNEELGIFNGNMEA